MCCLLLFYPRDKDHEFYNSATEIVKKDPPQPQRTHITSETLSSHQQCIDHSPPITDLSPKVSQMAKYAKERAFSLGRSGVSHDSQYGLR